MRVRVMLSLMLVGVGLLSGIGAGGPGVAQAAIEIGTNSCIGANACSNATGPIGDNSCNGDFACAGTTGRIGAGSCVGYAACYQAVGPIGAGSCNYRDACRLTTGSIGDNSCNSSQACINATGPIGDNSCNVLDACRQVAGSVAGSVGSDSCNAYNACKDAVGSIGNNSCNDRDACSRAVGSIGNNSCTGEFACAGNNGSVGNNSCNSGSNRQACIGSVGDCQYNDVTPAVCPAPETTLDSGPTGTVASPHATFTFSSSLPGSTFECSLDGAAFSPCTTPRTYTDLAIGAHTFEVRAIHNNDNTDPTPASTSWTIAIPYGEFNPSHTCATGSASVSFLGVQLTPGSADRWVLQRVWVYSTANGGSWTTSDYYMALFNAAGTEPQTFYRWTGSAWLAGSSQYDVSVPQGTSAAFYVQSWWLEGETWEGPWGTWSRNSGSYWCGYSGPESKLSSVTDLKPPSRAKLNRSLDVPSFIGAPSRRNQPRSDATQTGSTVGAVGISRGRRSG